MSIDLADVLMWNSPPSYTTRLLPRPVTGRVMAAQQRNYSVAEFSAFRQCAEILSD